MEKILFVCTGNTCRSFMAEEIFNDIIKKNKLADEFTADSAGVSVYMNSPASKNAVKAMKNRGIKVSNHVAKQVDADMLKNADVVLTMGKTHKAFLDSHFPMYSDKVYTLSEYASGIESFAAEANLSQDKKDELTRMRKEINILTKEKEDLYRKLFEIESELDEKTEELLEYKQSIGLSNNSMADIPDPYGSDLETYKETADIIAERINKIINFIANKEEN